MGQLAGEAVDDAACRDRVGVSAGDDLQRGLDVLDLDARPQCAVRRLYDTGELLTGVVPFAPRGLGEDQSGGAVDGARNGRLTLFAGGEPSLLERVAPVLETLGTVIPCGGLGTGNVVKLVTNQLWFTASAALGEGFALGLRHGVDLGVLWSAVRQSVGDSFVARHDAPSVFAGHYDPSFTLDLCGKDLRLIGELQTALGASLPMTDAARGAFDRAVRRYGPDPAELHVAKHIEDDTGLSFRLDGDWCRRTGSGAEVRTG
ncbi:hypothetical protein C1I97_34150 [Streptomyces sp. NTH33]|uniref:NAD(P)-dependent oxidoreductase n=1 Tax=Streptomyces sp. NTH33 TaxID=1735453 RepID=UPI000DA8DE04|nr:NAD-binding protein [Streptomyces sp. NTH33]PZG84287.1 hypothetical protein C1I97_34150 [Streptomyces sp. NTH33]